MLLKWEAGDLVLLDVCSRWKLGLHLHPALQHSIMNVKTNVIPQNYAVMHSRQPWVGKRTVLAALWDQGGRIEDFEEGKSILRNRV